MADPTGELERERKTLAHIQSVHAAALDRARRVAQGLADEAAEATEEGIRDLVDEDAEVDAAVRAALVRQTSDRAMFAARRVAELEAQGAALAFGHITDTDDERLHIGRLSVIDGDEPLLVDWRARAAVRFYRATPGEPMGLSRRRNLLYDPDGDGQPDDLIDYTDEVFDLDSLDDDLGLRGEAAILAAVNAPTAEQMQSVVATIQAEQDAVVRASAKGPLVVQGGPGTGKTVVALHRAAYLLYDQRDELADTGVLIVGPSPEFLRYIAGVLPSLGESGVLSMTADKLYAGIRTGRVEADAVAELKGREEMVRFLANAVADRRRVPKAGLTVYYGSRRVDLTHAAAVEWFERACRHRLHNDGAAEFRSLVVDGLVAEIYDPAFVNPAEARDTFRSLPVVKEFLLRHFPPLSPERVLNDLFGSAALLRSAARGTSLAADEVDLLARPRAGEDDLEWIRWSRADVPLLDELLHLLGGSMGQTEEEQVRARDELDEFQKAQEADEQAAEDELPVERDDELDDETEELLSFDDPWFADAEEDGSL